MSQSPAYKCCKCVIKQVCPTLIVKKVSAQTCSILPVSVLVLDKASLWKLEQGLREGVGKVEWGEVGRPVRLDPNPWLQPWTGRPYTGHWCRSK